MGSTLQDLRYIDLAKFLEKKKYIQRKEGVSYYGDKKRVVAEAEFKKYYLIINSSPTPGAVLRSAEESSLFYKACPQLAKFIPEEVREDVFYTYLLGYQMNGIPSRLVYILKKAYTKFDTPNVAISMISRNLLEEFLVEGALPKEYSISDVAANVWSGDVKIMSPYRKRAVFKNLVEMYVERTSEGELFDTVVVLPTRISELIEESEIAKVVYTPKKGLELNGNLLRKYNGSVGITVSDVDLRNCI